MHSDALGDQFTNVIPASGRPEKGADHFLDLRSRLERSSLFRLARRCVPSCEKRAMGIGHILCNDPSLMRQTSRKDLRSPFMRRTTNIINATNLALAELEGALLLADLEELHHALLIGSLTSDLLDDVADKLDAASRALRIQ